MRGASWSRGWLALEKAFRGTKWVSADIALVKDALLPRLSRARKGTLGALELLGMLSYHPLFSGEIELEKKSPSFRGSRIWSTGGGGIGGVVKVRRSSVSGLSDVSEVKLPWGRIGDVTLLLLLVCILGRRSLSTIMPQSALFLLITVLRSLALALPMTATNMA